MLWRQYGTYTRIVECNQWQQRSCCFWLPMQLCGNICCVVTVIVVFVVHWIAYALHAVSQPARTNTNKPKNQTNTFHANENCREYHHMRYRKRCVNLPSEFGYFTSSRTRIWKNYWFLISLGLENLFQRNGRDEGWAQNGMSEWGDWWINLFDSIVVDCVHGNVCTRSNHMCPLNGIQPYNAHTVHTRR